MTPVIKWSMWSRRRSILLWAVGISLFLLLNMVFYPSFKNDAEELQKSFESMPDAAVQLLGGSTDFFSPIGFLNSQIYYMMLPMLLIFLAINLGSSLLAKEEQDNTIELLLSRPVSRSKLLLAKAITGILILSGITLVAALVIIVTAQIVELEVSTTRILEATLVCYLLALTIGAVALCLTALGKARRLSIGLSVFVALGGYLVSSLSGTVEWLEKPSRLLPFSYYQSEAILHGLYDWLNILYFVLAITAATVISWFLFRRRDLG